MGCLSLNITRVGAGNTSVLVTGTDHDVNVEAHPIRDYNVIISGNSDCLINVLPTEHGLDIHTEKKNSISTAFGLVCSTGIGKKYSILWVKEGRFLTLSGGKVILKYE